MGPHLFLHRTSENSMSRDEWGALALRAAMVRHKMWCLATEDGVTGERVGPCGDEPGTIRTSCRGPKSGDLELGKQIVLEFWGKPEGSP